MESALKDKIDKVSRAVNGGLNVTSMMLSSMDKCSRLLDFFQDLHLSGWSFRSPNVLDKLILYVNEQALCDIYLSSAQTRHVLRVKVTPHVLDTDLQFAGSAFARGESTLSMLRFFFPGSTDGQVLFI